MSRTDNFEHEVLSRLTGKDFLKLVDHEIEKRRVGAFGGFSEAELLRLSGLSQGYLRTLRSQPEPNPSNRSMRLILFVLGFKIQGPEQDVIPHLKSKRVYDPKLHEARAS